MAKVKYPLTAEAKEAAKSLVEAWGSGEIEQRYTFAEHRDRDSTRTRTVSILTDFKSPSSAITMELSLYGLISFDKQSYEVLLLQELRNAVASDFEVSDFFLTTQAVGTIINAAEGSSVDVRALQSAASAFGDIQQTQINTSAELASKLLQMLDPSMLEENPDLAEAIRGLATVEEPKRKLQFGKVISQLGNSLQHTANTVVIIQALGILFQFLYSNKIL